MPSSRLAAKPTFVEVNALAASRMRQSCSVPALVPIAGFQLCAGYGRRQSRGNFVPMIRVWSGVLAILLPGPANQAAGAGRMIMPGSEIMVLALVLGVAAVAVGTAVLERQQGRIRRIVKDMERRIAGS
jgi:hypothetical protein